MSDKLPDHTSVIADVHDRLLDKVNDASDSVNHVIKSGGSINSRGSKAQVKRIELRLKLLTEKHEAEMELKNALFNKELKAAEAELAMAHLEHDDSIDENASLKSEQTAQCSNDKVNDYLNRISPHTSLGRNLIPLSPSNRNIPVNFEVPKLELSPFDGNVMEYWKFTKQFDNVFEDCKFRDRIKLAYLIQYCKGIAKEAIEQCIMLPEEQGYLTARNILAELFGHSNDAAKRLLDDLINQTVELTQSSEGLHRLSIKLKNLMITLPQMRSNIDLDSFTTIEAIICRLPIRLHRKWTEVVDKLNLVGRDFRFTDLVEFITSEARKENSHFGRLENLNRKSNKPLTSGSKMTGSNYRSRLNVYSTQRFDEDLKLSNKCPLCNNPHKLEKCNRFIGLPVLERRNVVRKNMVCYKCLCKGHLANTCDKEQCSVNGCNGRHHSLLHVRILADSNVDSVINSTQHQAKPKVYLATLPVSVIANGKTRIVYALIDNGSDTTFISDKVANYLGLLGQDVSLTVRTVTGSSESKSTKVNFQLRSWIDSCNIDVRNAYSMEDSSFPLAHVVDFIQMKQWPHLNGIPIERIEEDRVGLIIGCDIPEAHWVLDQRLGRPGQPYGVKTKLGWMVLGPSRPSTLSCHINSLNLEDNEVKLLINRLYNREFSDLHSVGVSHSEEDKLAIKIAEKSMERIGSHMRLSLPWKIDPCDLPNNFELARNRLMSLYRRLAADNELAEKYKNIIDDHIKKGFIVQVDSEQLKEDYKPRWYLPHHPVINPKKPGKVRIVFDCAAKYNSISLNDSLLSGPNTISDLVGILLRFRKGKFAVGADIEEMFLQVKVPKKDAGALRFLWWPDAARRQPPVEYQLVVHPFGATSSPFCANFALKGTVDLFGVGNKPCIKYAVREHFYVDDCLASFSDVTEAKYFVNNITQVLSKGGFRLRKWISNEPATLQDLPVSEISQQDCLFELRHDQNERILGLNWGVAEDVFRFSFETTTKPETKRGILSYVSSLYDPLGFLIPMLLSAKLLLQELHKGKLGWDEPINDKHSRDWKCWLREIDGCRMFKIPRCVTPHEPGPQGYEFHVFCDASEKGYAATLYVRCHGDNGKFDCRLLVAKGRVAPLKSVSIPRLELAAATLAARLGETVRNELKERSTPIYYWSDSTIVLFYINNNTSRYSTYVANRLAVIHELTSTDHWRHVKGCDNPADYATRGLKIDDKRWDYWFNGPYFLRRAIEHRHEIQFMPDKSAVEYKHKEVITNSIIVSGTTHNILTYYSSWYKLLKGVAWLIRFKIYIRIMFSRNQDLSLNCGNLNTIEIEQALLSVVRIVQREAFSIDYGIMTSGKLSKTSRLRKLSPFLHEGILRVGGRLQYADITWDTKHPIILPPDHHVTELIIRHYHESEGHAGSTHTLASIRQRFWILSGIRTVKKVIHKCTSCIRRFREMGSQIMAPVPTARLNINGYPFQSVGIDYFGPFLVKRGRTSEKRYGCIFTCLTMRAVHLEIAHTYSTDSFIMMLTRFIARRGAPKEIFSDNGSNFVGADLELKRCLTSLSQRDIHERLISHNIDWHFNPPDASHRGGIWERMVKAIKRIFMSLLCEQKLTDEVLLTLMTEVERILNNRPLVPSEDDPLGNAPITPNMLLSPKTDTYTLPYTELKDRLNRRWKEVQSLSNIFWKRWIKEYLPLLQVRGKWFSKQRNFKVGDLVLVAGEPKIRNKWPLGLVQEVKTSNDGLVREVTVKTAKGLVRRDIRSISLLEGEQ